MSMPQIPEGKHRPTMQQTMIDLLESVALEEIAISHILNAQGEKTQEVIKKYATCNISYEQLQHGCSGTQDMLHALIMKEWLLYIKLRAVMDLPLQGLEGVDIAPDCPMPPVVRPIPPAPVCPDDATPQTAVPSATPKPAVMPPSVCAAYMHDVAVPSAQSPSCENCVHRHICAQHRRESTGCCPSCDSTPSAL